MTSLIGSPISGGSEHQLTNSAQVGGRKSRRNKSGRKSKRGGRKHRRTAKRHGRKHKK